MNNEFIWFHSIGNPLFDEKGEIEKIMFVAREVTEDIKSEEKLKHLALFDYLTDLPNRYYFYQILKEEVKIANEKKTIFAVMMLDIDHFKEINDTYGHDIGDDLIKGFSSRIQLCLRSNDVLARLGGDEFSLLMPNLPNKSIAIKMARKIIAALKSAIKIKDLSIKISTSIGITFNSPHTQTYKLLLKQADLALYKAKSEGRNTYEVFQDVQTSYKKIRENHKNKLKRNKQNIVKRRR